MLFIILNFQKSISKNLPASVKFLLENPTLLYKFPVKMLSLCRNGGTSPAVIIAFHKCLFLISVFGKELLRGPSANCCRFCGSGSGGLEFQDKL